MSIFGSIMHKIFHHDAAAAEPAPTASADPAAAPAPSAAADAAPEAKSAPSEPVDVQAVCSAMAASKGGGGNWQTSIVDLLKLLDLDSSLDARKELAQELSVNAGAPGTAEQNIALHHAVMNKLAENGGKVPDSMKG